ncbi:MAG: type I-E CRISPR-associated protein Cse1/CasA [Methylovulum sp.]|nr:type I-E CRISPR-associated protein Cse1/CasA [Methylovulum sp.]
MTEASFSLIDELWIPIADVGRVSLKQLFTESGYRALGGNPVQKIALTKLLLAIAQAAYTPEDDDDWAALGAGGMAEKCLVYLEQWRDRFDLYGERPFLQLNELKDFKTQTIGALCQHIATGNTTILYQSQVEMVIDDAEWALMILVDQNFSVKHNLAYGALTLEGGKGKGKVTKSGPALGSGSYLHHFLQGSYLHQTIWFNQLSKEVINQLSFKYKLEQSKPVWEFSITDRESQESDIVKNSYLGRLCPLSRFIVRDGNKLKYCEGIVYPNHTEGVREVSVAFSETKNGETKALNVNPEFRPWRSLPALLSFFIIAHNQSSGWECLQLKLSLYAGRVQDHGEGFGIWSGGILLSGDIFSQFAKGNDDIVESNVWLENNFFEDPSGWITKLQLEIEELDQLSNIVYSSTLNYFKSQKAEGKKQAAMASHLYWQLCERQFQALVNVCYDFNQAQAMRKTFARFAQKAYDSFCPNHTARQLNAWAANTPNLGKYLKDINQPEQAKA